MNVTVPKNAGYSSAPLYHVDKSGGLRIWRVWTVGKTIVTAYGHLDGKIQYSRKDAEAKNVGTKAETKPNKQAIKEAKALYKHKKQRKYSETPEGAKEPSLLPMTAHKYIDKKKKFKFPADIQPKLDGLRCCARKMNGKVVLISRGGKELNVPHIREQLAWMDDDTVLDGELYLHGVSLQTINSWIPKPGQSLKPETATIQYHVYDVPIWGDVDELVWSEREINLSKVRTSSHVFMVETIRIQDYDEAIEVMTEFLEQGFEGAMLRMLTGVYRFGYRSSELLKLKTWEDEEFEVIDFADGKGKDKGLVKWIVQNNDGSDTTITVRPRGTNKQRTEWFQHGEDYIGKLLTVRFQYRTEDNSLFLPVGIVFRIDEDLPR